MYVFLSIFGGNKIFYLKFIKVDGIKYNKKQSKVPLNFGIFSLCHNGEVKLKADCLDDSRYSVQDENKSLLHMHITNSAPSVGDPDS